MSVADGISYCDSLVLGGYADWRLPKAIELLSIVDPGRFNPAIDPSAFPGTPSGSFWTSTPYAWGSDIWWVVVSFYDGASPPNSGSGSFWARCVR